MVMEKITPLTSADISEKSSIFKTHLSFIEKDWLKMHDNVIIDTYQSSTNHIFSAILNLTSEKQVSSCDFLIDDEASLEEIDDFLEKVLDDNTIRNLAWLFTTNLQSKHFDYVLRKIKQRFYGKHSENPLRFDHNMFISPTSKPEEMTVPQGYILGPLLAAHADVMTTQWALDIDFKGDFNLKPIVLANITERPCLGIFTEIDPTTPIAWLCLYSGGSIGMLHVKEAHRGRGLARILVRNTLKRVQETHGMECRVHACVKKENVASMGLFLSEGWQLQPFNYKKMFFRNS